MELVSDTQLSCLTLLDDDALIADMHTQFQSERTKLSQIKEDIATAVDEYVREEKKQYDEAKKKLLAKLRKAQKDETIQVSIQSFEEQSAAVQSLADKIVEGVREIAAQLENNEALSDAERETKMEHLNVRLSQIMLTDDEQSRLSTLKSLLGSVTTTSHYLNAVPNCALRGLALV